MRIPEVGETVSFWWAGSHRVGRRVISPRKDRKKIHVRLQDGRHQGVVVAVPVAQIGDVK